MGFVTDTQLRDAGVQDRNWGLVSIVHICHYQNHEPNCRALGIFISDECVLAGRIERLITLKLLEQGQVSASGRFFFCLSDDFTVVLAARCVGLIIKRKRCDRSFFFDYFDERFLVFGFLKDRILFVSFLNSIDPQLRIVAEQVDRHNNLLFEFIIVLGTPRTDKAGCLVVFHQVNFSCFLPHLNILT